MTYCHTQSAPLYWLLLATAAAQGVGAGALFLAGDTPALGVVLLATAAAVTLLAFSFQTLTIEDGGPELIVSFGPIPLLGTRVSYDEMTAAEVGQSSLLDGWGIHYVPGRGWIYNLWGFDCVILHLHDRVVRLGTDDADNLAAFLHHKLAARP